MRLLAVMQRDGSALRALPLGGEGVGYPLGQAVTGVAAIAGAVDQGAVESSNGPIVELELDSADNVRSVALLAPAGSVRAELFSLLVEHSIRSSFSADVLGETADLLVEDPVDDEALADRRDLPFVTIDNADSRDLDQALFVDEGPHDGYTVHYAIADAAHYVRPGSALLEEALRRGASYYLPGYCVPMLPRALSEGLVSLNPGVERRALIFAIQLDRMGRALSTGVVRAVICSRAKLAFDQVQRYYDAPESSPLRRAVFRRSIDLLRTVGELRIGLARARGVIGVSRRRVEVAVGDAGGKTLSLREELRADVERYNEQLSLLCNVEGARLLVAGGDSEQLQPVFRTHPAPEPGQLDELEATIRAVVAHHSLDPAVWRWHPQREDLASYLARLPRHAQTRRVRRAVERQILYANRASLYAPEAAPHHALAVASYARFSSPMREIAGIFTHKELLELLGMETPARSSEADEALRERVIGSANRARQLQRTLDKDVLGLAIAQHLRGDLQLVFEQRPRRSATVIGLRGSRLYVELDELPLELKVYTRDLVAHYGCDYQADAAGATLLPQLGEHDESQGPPPPRFAVGTAVAVRTVGFDEQRRRWQLIAEPLAHSTVTPELPTLAARAGYDRWSAIYDDEDNPLIALEEPQVNLLLGDVRGLRVIDVGCGTGRHALALAAAGASVTGLDGSPGMLRRAKGKRSDEPLQLLECDIQRGLPLCDGSFDRAVCSLVLEHVPDLRGLLAELRRVLRPQGWAVVSDLHPAMGLRGLQARFTDPATGRKVQVASAHHQLSDYVMGAQAAGMRIERMGEHIVDESLVARSPRAARYLGWPMLLTLRLRPA